MSGVYYEDSGEKPSVSIIAAYAPAAQTAAPVKQQGVSENKTLKRLAQEEERRGPTVVMGDFNARVPIDLEGDTNRWGPIPLTGKAQLCIYAERGSIVEQSCAYVVDC